MIQNMLPEVEKCKRKFPQAWKDAHTGNAHTEDFIRILASALHAIDARFGLNGKRGDPNDISDDAINYIGEGPGHDPQTGLPVTVFDVIRGAGGPNPQPSWDCIDQPGPGAWVKPMPVIGPPEPPTPPAPPKASYPDESTFWKAFQERMRQAYSDKGRTFPDPNDADAFRRFSRCGFDIGQGMEPQKAADKHIGELRQELGV